MTATDPTPNPSDDLGLTDAERLATLRAVAGGNAAAIAALGKRLAGLHDLLDLELEDAPGAELYLSDAKSALNQITQLAARLVDAAASPADALEPIDLHKLVGAANERLQRINKNGYAVTAEPAVPTVVNGDLFLLQQTFLDLPALFPATAPVPVAFATLDDGPAVAVAFGGDVRQLIAEAVRLFEKPVPAEHREVLAELAGLAAVHGGRVLTSKDKQAYLLLIPQLGGRAAGYEHDEASAIRGNETVLLVDDEDMIWDVVIDMLQSLGYTVILAGNGRECVEIYRDNPGTIDLVLLDMIMPEMNGRDAFHALKKIDPEVRVLLQSGYVAEDEARDVLDSGACGFLRKPYRMVDLAARIREIMK